MPEFARSANNGAAGARRELRGSSLSPSWPPYRRHHYSRHDALMGIMGHYHYRHHHTHAAPTMAAVPKFSPS
eukprot:650255-Alexandrium_andersonii.AAC.1